MHVDKIKNYFHRCLSQTVAKFTITATQLSYAVYNKNIKVTSCSVTANGYKILQFRAQNITA